MPKLHDLQRDFARSVLRGENFPSEWLRANGIPSAKRLAIYRNNSILGLTEALRDGFPVVNRLVGEAFFDAMARRYVCLNPPRSPRLFEYGTGFPAFLANYHPARSLPYLADVAKLEWLRQEAFQEGHEEGLKISALDAVPPQSQGGVRLEMQPSARLMVSDYPVLRIWEFNQSGFTGDDRVNLREGGCRLLIVRPKLEVEIHSLDAGDYALLTALAKGATLIEAADLAITSDDYFNLFTSLLGWLQRGLFTHLSHSIQGD
ncbi:HvfC/BufC N-terminal domain-containing protein [Methyloterricola oryzae]|uniref:HvfC/BufC N-terminal domain-containing protein n=1 Tax=Methyloterricola oryzae TaxID=1495050 RepID=UPI0005EB8BA6|nr:DUF2063 domain-containing protein [Methyloterricola oryzae]